VEIEQQRPGASSIRPAASVPAVSPSVPAKRPRYHLQAQCRFARRAVGPAQCPQSAEARQSGKVSLNTAAAEGSHRPRQDRRLQNDRKPASNASSCRNVSGFCQTSSAPLKVAASALQWQSQMPQPHARCYRAPVVQP
jgi:hypothetical protein